MNIIKKSYFDVDCSLVLDERYAHKNGTHNINIVIYYQGQYYHHRTGLKLKAWTDASPREQQSVYKMYDKLYNLAADLVDQQVFSIQEFKERLTAPVCETLNDFMKVRIAKYKKENQFSTAGHYSSALRLYTKVCGETPFAKVTATPLNKLLEYMKANEYSNATIEIYFSDLKSIINEASYKGLIKEVNYPFKKHAYDTTKVEIPKSARRTMSFLTKEEMHKVYEYYKKTQDPFVGLFLFSYLAGGMNLADVMRLKWNQHYFDTDQKEFIYKRVKTEKKNDFFIRVAISDVMREIIGDEQPVFDEYVFPYLRGTKTPQELRLALTNACHRVNTHLKKMCRKLKFDKEVTPTFARHSYSTILRRESVPGDFVEYSMGHSMKGSAGNYFGGYTTEQMLEFNSKLLKLTA